MRMVHDLNLQAAESTGNAFRLHLSWIKGCWVAHGATVSSICRKLLPALKCTQASRAQNRGKA